MWESGLDSIITLKVGVGKLRVFGLKVCLENVDGCGNIYSLLVVENVDCCGKNVGRFFFGEFFWGFPLLWESFSHGCGIFYNFIIL